MSIANYAINLIKKKRMDIYNKNKPETIKSMFGSIAKSYDRTNAILSLQLHKLWNQKLIQETIGKNTGVLADLCCGTGIVTYSWLKKVKDPQKAYLIDFCPEMLEYAKQRANENKMGAIHQLEFIQADVQDIPLTSSSVEFATMAYGVRNVQSPLQCFREVHRIMKPGGTFGILELTEPTNTLLRFGHNIYLRNILPILGKMLTSNKDAYQYLSNSIQNFIKPHEVALLMKEAGFKYIEITPLTGGIATIISGKK